MLAFAAGLALGSASTSLEVAAQGSDAGQFDGAWRVGITFPDVTDGARVAKGYSFVFPAQVAGGVLHGQYGVEGAPDSLRIDGTIRADGTATLLARGLVGDPDYAVGRAAKSTPYWYHIEAKFEATRGSGRRTELRPCEFIFIRGA